MKIFDIVLHWDGVPFWKFTQQILPLRDPFGRDQASHEIRAL
jgi:hypothetical protein